MALLSLWTSNPDAVTSLSIEQIETNPFNPRTNFEADALTELCDSIKEHGIIQPHGKLLINSKFRDRLGTPANIDLFQCEIEGVCSVSYAERNFDHFDYLAKGVENPQLEFLHQQYAQCYRKKDCGDAGKEATCARKHKHYDPREQNRKLKCRVRALRH